MQEQINKAPEDSAFKNGCQWHLYRLQDTSPPGPVYVLPPVSLPSVTNGDPSAPPSEPKNLSHLAYYQIERLKDLSNSWIATPNMDVSIQAVIQAYRAGDLDADPTLISYWLNGQMVHGPSSDKVEDLAAKTREWTEKYGPGQIHIEQVVVDLPTQQAAVAIYEADPDPSKDNKDKVIGPKPSFHHVCRFNPLLPQCPRRLTETSTGSK